MIPVLFNKNEQQFRSYGLGQISDIISPKVTRERNGQYLLYFQYPNDKEFSSIFEEGMKIKSDAGVRTKWQTFEISRIVRAQGKMIEIYAKHISQFLLKNALNPDITIRESNAQQALTIWKNNLVGDEDFDVWSDVPTINSTSWDVERVSNAFEALAGVRGSVLDVWGGEYEFDNKTVRLHREMGRKATVVLEYGRNITALEQDKKDDNVYTSIYPYATYTQEGGTEKEIITLPEIYVDGKYLNVHNKRKIQTVDFTSEFDTDTKPTVERLRTLANSYADSNEIGAPHENIKVEYVDLSKTLDYEKFQVMEEVELNDTLPIFYPTFGITNNNAKVVTVNYDPVKEANISIELGVIGQSFRNSVVGGINDRVEQIANSQERFENNTLPYLINAQGNRVWYSVPPEDVEHKIGDTWFEENGQYTRIRLWNGNQWVTKIDSEDIDKNAQAIQIAQTEVEAAKQAALDSYTNAMADAQTYVTTNIDSIVTNYLSSDMITSTHLKSDTALIDKIFATDANVQRLTAKTAFINSIKAIDISADKITTGTLNAANVNIINLNADIITTGTLRGIELEGLTIRGSTFIQENALTGSTYGRWDRTGITMRDPAGLLIMDMNRQGLNFHGSGVSHKGTYINNDLIDTQNLNVYNLNVSGSGANLLSANFDGNVSIGSATGSNSGLTFRGQSVPVGYPRMIWAGFGNSGDGLYTYFNGWRKLQTEITNITNISMNALTVNSLTISNNLLLTNRLSLQNAGLQFSGGTIPNPVDRQMWIGYGYSDNGLYVSMGGNWYKHGTTISDRRLKQNIVDSTINSLDAISSWNFVEYEWANRELGEGVNFGLVAQDTSHISNYYTEVDRWEIDSGKQIMMNSHAIQQLARRELNTNKATETNTQKIKRLEQRIKELESAI